MLQHAMLVDAGLVSEGVLADDGLVTRDGHARNAGDQPRGRIEAAGLNAGGDIEERLAGLQRHDDFLERAVAGALTDAIDGAFDLAGTRNDSSETVRDSHAQIVVTVD